MERDEAYRKAVAEIGNDILTEFQFPTDIEELIPLLFEARINRLNFSYYYGIIQSEVIPMMIDSRKIITVTEANQNFSKATRIADQHGDALVFKNNRPKYKITNLEMEPDLELTDDEKIDVIARRILERYKPAFLELAK